MRMKCKLLVGAYADRNNNAFTTQVSFKYLPAPPYTQQTPQ